MFRDLYCLQFTTTGDHHVFNGFVGQLRVQLDIVHDEVHSEDEHNWVFFLRCDNHSFEQAKAIAMSELKHITRFEAFPLASPNTHSMRRGGDKRVILNSKYPE
jgi:hypothetical protein